MPSPERVIAYIDGFNLYYGLKEAFGRKYLWLDLEAMCRSLLRTHQTLVGVKYFTASVRGPSDSQARQSTYIDAMRETTLVEPIYGRLQLNEIRCRSCGAVRLKPEEKKTDVAIASHMLADAYGSRADVALLVSGDSDMVPPVEMINLVPGRRVVVAFPPRRKSTELQTKAGAAINISEAAIRQSQLPTTLTLPNGTSLSRPSTWN